MIKRRNKKGFTIVELVIVIAVIGVLTAILIPTFVNLNSKANKAADSSLVQNLNKALRIEEVNEGKNKTMHDAVVDVEEYGYKLANLVAKSDEKLLWNQEKDEFLLDNGSDDLNTLNYWEIRTSLPQASSRSIYAGNWNGSLAVTVDYGFDVGFNVFQSVTYSRPSATAGQEVTIRTNSLETSLAINAPKDTVHREGKAKTVDPLISANHSFVDNGTAPWVTLKQGNYVVTPNTEVGTLYLDVDKTNEDQTLEITLQQGTELPNLARAAVDLEENELVKIVEVTTEETNETETYYLQGDGTIEGGDVLVSTTGNEEDAQPVSTQNPSETAQAIANIIVDDEVQETGYTQEEAQDKQEEAITEAQTEEVAEEEDFSSYEARIGLKGYTSFRTAVETAVDGDTVVLLKDVDIQTRLTISGKNITIDGTSECHSIRASHENIENGRTINIFDGNISTVLRNLKIIGPTSGGYTRGLNIADENNTLKIVNCEITCNSYAVNFCSGTTIDVDINKTKITGYAALNIWSDGIAVKIKNSELTGLNDKGLSSWNTFSTICFEGDTTHATTMHSSNMNILCEDSVVKAISTTGNKHAIVGFNTNCLNNKISFNRCEFVYGDETVNSLYYDYGTNSSVLVDGAEKILSFSGDYTNLHINDDKVTATGSIDVIFGEARVTLNLAEADSAVPWSNGTDYNFYNVEIGGIVVPLFDLDISAEYATGYALYVTKPIIH